MRDIKRIGWTMNTRYQYIHFVKVRDTGKTTTWECRNNTSYHTLGTVSWYGPWRQYCFNAGAGCVFNGDCLAHIQDFIGQLMLARKQAPAKEQP